MHYDNAKGISIQSPLQLGGSQGRESTLGVLGWSTGGVIFIGKLIQGLDFSRIMCASMMEQSPSPQQKIKKINNILNIEAGSMYCFFHVIYKLVFLWCVCICLVFCSIAFIIYIE